MNVNPLSSSDSHCCQLLQYHALYTACSFVGKNVTVNATSLSICY